MAGKYKVTDPAERFNCSKKTLGESKAVTMREKAKKVEPLMLWQADPWLGDGSSLLGKHIGAIYRGKRITGDFSQGKILLY